MCAHRAFGKVEEDESIECRILQHGFSGDPPGGSSGLSIGIQNTMSGQISLSEVRPLLVSIAGRFQGLKKCRNMSNPFDDCHPNFTLSYPGLASFASLATPTFTFPHRIAILALSTPIPAYRSCIGLCI